jgi:UrcA family protein
MSRFTIHTAIAAAALFVCTVPLVAAQAAAAETEQQAVSIRTAGLNLTSPEGAALLRQRVQGAARAVCGTADTRDLQAMADMKACRAVAMEGADLQIRAAVAAASRNAHLASARHTEVSDNRH